MSLLPRVAALASILLAAVLSAGCTTTLIVVHVIDKLTEGGPVPCHKLNSVERALQTRCGPFVAGSLKAADVAAPGLPVCPLAVAARHPALWPVLPELIARGANPERCAEPPLAALAHELPCAPFETASPAEIAALRWLAEADLRAVQHDTVRLLSCPSARAAGLHTVLDGWLAQGHLARGTVPFGVLGALHPTHLYSPFAARLEAQGHTARDGLGAYAGALPSGFDAALRSGDMIAVDWWLDRVPELARRVPGTDSHRLSWVPLAHAITPAYQPDAELREQTVIHLLARGADPMQRLPHDANLTVLALAQQVRSPLLPLLQAHRARSVAAGTSTAPVAAATAAPRVLR